MHLNAADRRFLLLKPLGFNIHNFPQIFNMLSEFPEEVHILPYEIGGDDWSQGRARGIFDGEIFFSIRSENDCKRKVYCRYAKEKMQKIRI